MIYYYVSFESLCRRFEPGLLHHLSGYNSVLECHPSKVNVEIPLPAPFDNKGVLMALPIKETPILRGKEAEEFRKRIENPGSISKEEYERAKKVYEELEQKKIIEVYDAILKHDLKPNTIICSVCGNAMIKGKKIFPCEHLKEIFKNILRE